MGEKERIECQDCIHAKPAKNANRGDEFIWCEVIQYHQPKNYRPNCIFAEPQITQINTD